MANKEHLHLKSTAPPQQEEEMLYIVPLFDLMYNILMHACPKNAEKTCKCCISKVRNNRYVTSPGANATYSSLNSPWLQHLPDSPIKCISRMGGRIDISKLKIPPEEHELETARYFAALGYDVEFILPSNIPEVHKPDILMNGIEWEIKCPRVKSKRTMENNLRKAIEQSHNIIFDLRRVKLSEKECIQTLVARFNKNTFCHFFLRSLRLSILLS